MKDMEPTNPGGSHSSMPKPHAVECVRCHHELQEYSFARLPLHPYGGVDGHVMLECPKCGHVEFLASSSPLVAKLQALPTYVGDGD